MLKIKDKKDRQTVNDVCIKEANPGLPLILHDEPIYLDNNIIGRTTSGNYSFNFNKNLTFGYVNSGNTFDTLKAKIFI